MPRPKQNSGQLTFFSDLQLPMVTEAPKPAVVAKPAPLPKPAQKLKERRSQPKAEVRHQPAAGESWLVKWQNYADKPTPCYVLRYDKVTVYGMPHVTVALQEPGGRFGVLYYPVDYLIRKLAEGHSHLADSYYRQQQMSPAQIRHYLGLLKAQISTLGDDMDDEPGDEEDDDVAYA